MTCPICSTTLDANGLAAIDLTPSSEKVKALCGLDPSFILQVASRAIDFYNFQSSLAQAHDTQELESTRHCLQHQTQQNGLAQKDLGNQLRAMKYQLEAIAAERDAQARKVQELQTRLDHQAPTVASFPPPRSAAPIEPPLSSQIPSTRNVLTFQDQLRPTIPQRIFETTQETSVPASDHSSNPYRPNWPSNALYLSHNAPNEHEQVSAPASARTERRTRIFSGTNSPAPTTASVRSIPSAPSPARSTQGYPQESPRAALSTLHYQTNGYNTGGASSSVPFSPSTASSAPKQATSARFTALGGAPPRPETPLLHQLAGLSATRPRI